MIDREFIYEGGYRQWMDGQVHICWMDILMEGLPFINGLPGTHYVWVFRI